MTTKGKRYWCAVYTRKSTEEGLEQSFNSLEAQREAGIAYIQSQAQEGWCLRKTRYDDGGYSGGSLERPALQLLLKDIQTKQIQIVVVYKVDRLTRSLRDFAKLVEIFENYQISFASVTQPVNTTTSTGRLMLNVLLSFAQFEREVTGERIRDKIAASKRKGMWMGGMPPLGYDLHERTLQVNNTEAQVVRQIFQRYVTLKAVGKLKQELEHQGYRTKRYHSRGGKVSGGKRFARGHLYRILKNRLYRGEIEHKGAVYPGEHKAIIDETLWNQVQTILARNRQTFVSDDRVRSPSLLKGFLYDDAGNRMSPSHGRKGSRRYHYYISQAVLQYREHEVGSVARLSSHELEQVVRETIQKTFGQNEKTQLTARRLAKMSTQESHQFLRQVIKRVVVSRTKLRITLNRLSEDSPSNVEAPERFEDSSDHTPLTVDVPFEIVQRRGTCRILINGAQSDMPKKPNPVLVNAVIQGYRWREQLLNGQVNSIKDLARKEGIHTRYLMRIVRVGFLEPDIMEAILNGTQPADMTLEQFRRPIPLEWSKQRRLFGFASP